MGERAIDAAGPTSAIRLFGSEVRAARTRAGLSLAGLCDLFRDEGRMVHRGYLAKVESGDRFPTDRLFAEIADHVLATDGLLTRLWDFAETQRAGQHDQAQQTRRLVAQFAADNLAPVISGNIVFVPYVVGADIVAYMRMSRRAFLATGGLAASCPRMTATGGIATASARLRAGVAASGLTPIEHLRSLRRLLVDNDNMLGARRVIPTVHEQIRVIQALRHESVGSDQRQLMELQAQFAELASWLHQDTGDFSRAGYWLDRALEWSQAVGDAELTAYVMARKSQVAGEARDLGEVVDLAGAAQGMTRPGSRVAAVGKTYEALGRALRGEADASNRAFDEARTAVEKLTPDPGPWAAWLNVPYVEIHRAQAVETLGQHAHAADIFATAIEQLPAGYHRDRGGLPGPRGHLPRRSRGPAAGSECRHAGAVRRRGHRVRQDPSRARPA